MRLSELVGAGITTATISRMLKRGDVVRLGRGLYQHFLSGAAQWDGPIDRSGLSYLLNVYDNCASRA